jgi:hypothetical protein
MQNKNSQILIYKTDDWKIKVDTLLKDETIWMSQKNMSVLFDCTTYNIALHIKNIYETWELSEKWTSEDFSVVQKKWKLGKKHLIEKF